MTLSHTSAFSSILIMQVDSKVSKYHDSDPCFDLCLQAQQYYEQHGYSTHVKACSLTSVDEVMKLAGVKALTLTPDILEALTVTNESEVPSIFDSQDGVSKQPIERQKFIDNEAMFRTTIIEDKGLAKMNQVSPYEFSIRICLVCGLNLIRCLHRRFRQLRFSVDIRARG